ncbi:histidinol-phosphate transaminase [Gulosibacter sediminis]|uniref:histidinol-phosphate transaminase n=1 Tax=Gulosibacter sediminis TaxID=1729695 RepID=UPI0024AD9968|nr:histidinol-phosphate transaminase [Gulosibacter sediminis]
MTSFEDLPIRDDLRGLTPYGAPQDALPITINVNENPFSVPEAVALSIIQRISLTLPGLNRYPDREFTELRERLATYLGQGLTPEHIWAANGSNEVLQQLLQAFAGAGRKIMSFAPTYSMYPLLAKGVGSEWVAAPRDENFELTPELVRTAIEAERPDVVLLCTPNNPTGTPLDLETIEAAYDATDGIVVVDEAYAEFRHDGAPTALSLLEGRPRLVISRTMSKAFAFAGVRLGYFAADPAVADAVRLVRLPYHLSAITQAAAIAALEHSDTMLAQVDRIRIQRDRIVDETAALGYRPYRSDANFVLIGGVADPAVMFDEFVARGILIRNTGPADCIRVTAGTESETDAYLSALAEITAARPELQLTSSEGVSA